jgi:hypothetical protein
MPRKRRRKERSFKWLWLPVALAAVFAVTWVAIFIAGDETFRMPVPQLGHPRTH